MSKVETKRCLKFETTLQLLIPMLWILVMLFCLFLSNTIPNAYFQLKNYHGGNIYIRTHHNTSRRDLISRAFEVFPENVGIFLVDVLPWSEYNSVTIPIEERHEVDKLIKSNLRRRNLQIDCVLKIKHSLLHFLRNTTSAWAFVFDDDLDYAPYNFDRALSFLDAKYSTDRDSVVIGQLIGGLSFIGGGSGFVFSRKFAQIYLEKFNEEVSKMAQEEDFFLTSIGRKYAKIPDMYYGTYGFSEIADDDMKRIHDRNFGNLPLCSEIKKDNYQWVDFRLSRGLALHKPERLEGEKLADVLKEVPSNVSLYFKPRTTRSSLCINNSYNPY